MGTYAAPVGADLAAYAEIALGAMLLVGWVLVRFGHVRAHAMLQSTIVLVNIPIVLYWMVPSYLEYVAPGVPGELGESFYLYPTLMLVAGLTAEVLGIYILLVAGTNLVPERLRFRRYKLWMRSMLGLWWAVLGLGLATYATWYTVAL
ncbi:MAG TPA: hypothetical protein VMH90_03315 [Thermoplasmata archaeon]|nr:hypothetical protein [Thermoplasmata archaeon]